jgi:hypothetical protein
MTVVNLPAGYMMFVDAGQINRNANVYRTNDGFDTPGEVGWLPDGGVMQYVELAVGGNANFAINGRSGIIANGCASRVQALYDNNPPADALKVTPRIASEVMRKAKLREAVAADGSLQQAMETLNAQWYNALTSRLNLDPKTFQLMQGNNILGTLSETLWNIFDAVPPLSVNNFFNPSQYNSFSSNYGSIINNLNQPGADTFQNDMGDYYSQWSAYLKTLTTLPTGGLMALFNAWSQLNMPAGQAAQCYTDLSAIYQGTVYSAIQTWISAGGSSATTKAYDITVEQVNTKLNQQGDSDKKITMNSKTQSSDTSQTWAQGEVGGLCDIFEGEASGSYNDISMAIVNAGLNISATFTHVATMTAAPLRAPSQDPILSQYEPWFEPGALNLALQNDNNVVWKNNPPTWDNMFNPASGSLLRVASALVIVDGIDIEITSSASVSVSDQAKFTAQAEAGFFPFFETEVSGGWQNNLSFENDGTMTFKSSSPVGSPVLLGAIVSPISAAALLPSTDNGNKNRNVQPKK